MYYAHSGPSPDRWEPLRVHLLAVAERAATFASPFGAADEARLAGLLHDLGKYSDLFTQRLHGKAKGLDHWSAGAHVALQRYGPAGLATALAIQGHHVGLLSLPRLMEVNLERTEPHPLGLRLTETRAAALLERFQADGFALPALPASLFERSAPSAAGMLDVRLLFSALVDADFLETEAHFQAAADGTRRHRPDGPALRPAEALAHLQEHLARLARDTPAAPEVARLRNDLLAACLDAAGQPQGLFTLSAPTGAGKTLAMLAFALRHAAVHGLRRVVLAIPYLSILEQTARIYRGLFASGFDPNYVLEHHSLAGTRREPGEGPQPPAARDQQEEPERLARWLTENWDAPLILTTNVQLLESLFSNRPAACRKLHRLAGSVILFDEVQTLPPRLAVPTLAALSRLAERYGASVVFATATQPAFDHLHEAVCPLAAPGWQPREIVPESLGLFARARRTRVRWDLDRPLPWEALADELGSHEQVLCIVNLKRHARSLAGKLQARGVPGLFHLSTNLCPAHRERVLSEVRRRLCDGEPCRLVATQCVEAGVDVDFPRVYRALGPLEAVAQAAGRCNRNGHLPGLGEVRVFRPEDEAYPPGDYDRAAGVTRTVLGLLGEARMEDVQDPELFRRYYRLFYELAGSAKVPQKIQDALGERNFEALAHEYRLIEKDAISVLVPYDLDAWADLKAELRDKPLHAGWIRRARPHTVSLYRPKRDAPIWNHLDPAPLARHQDRDRDREAGEWFVYLDEDGYDRELLGLVGPGEEVWIA